MGSSGQLVDSHDEWRTHWECGWTGFVTVDRDREVRASHWTCPACKQREPLQADVEELW
ncbi:hypothetical protein ACFPRL_27490 [Pseudoclavibacter helvolus]|uniref:Uncharacterized protein n=1 Tax=Pseudoclavibacter helvolus TaxID=255205 RepID=A0A7W4UMQ8_9MICO|nr:hypothetical protein [Pseudoclavibacter helvolus]MBB2957300.1 hypothetical protein [Pseudoclavibacter helvolus]